MNKFEKIFITALCASNLMMFASDDHGSKNSKKQREQAIVEKQESQKSAAMWAGVAGIVGAVAGTAVGYWLASNDHEVDPQPVQYYYVEDFSVYHAQPLTKKGYQIKSQLDGLVKYGQMFDFYNDEQTIITNLYKLGFRLHSIDNNFYSKLAQDNKTLSDAGYSIWWHGIKSLENQKDFYLTNSNKLISYFNRHDDFIQCCRVINSYADIPLDLYSLPTIMIYPSMLPRYIFGNQYRSDKKYPLISYKNKIEYDRTALAKFQNCFWSSYPILVEKSQQTKFLLDQMLGMITASFEYQQQVEQKRQDELHTEWNRIEQDRLNIAREQARIYDEANRLAAERNRIERERNQNFYDDRF